jgi:hypothetical protein
MGKHAGRRIFRVQLLFKAGAISNVQAVRYLSLKMGSSAATATFNSWI